ncbi:MAG: hypothetical protein A2Y33_03320 [Spirochaetes bacterium GWF1_51_8]|nr:MAG: hypothetical protein A2Y33_03320 [Spirochaetes bacterium GWF1_51_8]
MSESKNNNMVLFIIIAFVVGIGAGAGGMMLFGGAGGPGGAVKSDKIYIHLAKASEVGADWLVKIDDYAISKSEFNDLFTLIKSTSPQFQNITPEQDAQLKYQYFESLIDEFIVTLQAVNKGNIDIKTANLLIDQSARQSIYTLFLKNNMPIESSFNPTEQEIEAFYQQYKDQFKQSGMNAEQIKQVSVENIKKLKLQQWMMSFVTHIKEGYKIERNFDALKELGISEMGMGGGMPGGQLLPGQGGMQPLPNQ